MQHSSILLTVKGNFELTKLDSYFRKHDFKFNFQSHNPDIYFIDGEEESSIKIGEIKQFIEWAGKKPFQYEKKIGVIWPAEKMTMQAQNSLLKTLEEPLENTIIVLLTRNPHQLLTTITSRTVDGGKLRGSLETENDSQAQLAAAFFAASPLERRKIATEKLAKFSRGELESFITDLIKYFRNNYCSLAEKIQTDNSLDVCLTAKKAVKSNANTRLVIENLLYI